MAAWYKWHVHYVFTALLMTWTLLYQLNHHNSWPCFGLCVSGPLLSCVPLPGWNTSRKPLNLHATPLGPRPSKHQYNFQPSLRLDYFPLTFLVLFSHSYMTLSLDCLGMCFWLFSFWTSQPQHPAESLVFISSDLARWNMLFVSNK